jgi:hypothetical protein
MPIFYIFSYLNLFYLFFISEHVLGGRVTVTDGDCRIYYTIMNMLLHNSYIIYGTSDPLVVYLHEVFKCPACVHVMKRPSSEEWHISIGPWFIVDAACVVNLVSVGIYCTRWTVTNGSSLEVVYGLLYKLMCKQTLNTLIWIEVFWSTEPIWNICIIWYFLNKQHPNETLVGAVIWTFNLRDRWRACYQLCHTASLLSEP